MRPGPIIRPVRRARVRQRRQTFGALVVVLTSVLAWQFWPSAGQERGESPSPPGGNNNGTPSGSPDPANGDSPIEHVVFIVKENRTFNHYFATYPGAEGATEGGTIELHARTAAWTGRPFRSPEAPMRTAARPHALLPLRPRRDQRRQDERLQLHDGVAWRTLTGVHRSTRPTDVSRTTGPTPIASSSRIGSSRRCTGRHCPEHLYAVAAQSNYIVDNKPTTERRAATATTTRSMRHGSPTRGREYDGAHHELEEKSPKNGRTRTTSRVLGEHPHCASTSRSSPTSSRRRGSAGSTTRRRTRG